MTRWQSRREPILAPDGHYLVPTNLPDVYGLVDAQDLPLVSGRRWTVKGDGYIVRTEAGATVRLHRLILPHIPIIDHANGDKLDNRRANLRVASITENNRNRPRQRNNTSGFKGVHWDSLRGKWTARIKHDGRSIRVGRFDDIRDAARAYDEAAIRYHGDYASLNFPLGDAGLDVHGVML